MSAKLKTPPIFYTLGVLKFNAVLNMKDFIAGIQSDWRQEYPDFQQDTVTEVQINLGTGTQGAMVNTVATERWNFRNAAATSGLSVTPTQVLFHTTAYEDSKAFIKAMLDGLGTVHKHVKLAYVESVGVRLLDAVIPQSESHDLSFYLNAGALGLRQIMDGTLQQGISQAVFETASGTATARAVVSSGELALPTDLLPMKLKINPRFAPNGPHVVLDNQCLESKRIDIDLAEIGNRIRMVKRQASQAFDRSVTPQAMDIWR